MCAGWESTDLDDDESGAVRVGLLEVDGALVVGNVKSLDGCDREAGKGGNAGEDSVGSLHCVGFVIV